MAPVLTPLVAFLAFMGQQHQLRLQKEDYSLTRFTETFFKLIEIHSHNVQDLIYQDPSEGKTYQGRSFMKKTYQDLMKFFHDKKEQHGGKPFKDSMEKLDHKYGDNLHLYFKNLFQVFGWIYDHRKQMTKDRTILYVNVIRSQLSLNEMMILYMNTSYLRRNFFYKVLIYFDFFEKYNTDGFGKGVAGIENKFINDVEIFIGNKEEPETIQKPSVTQTFTREALFNAIENKEIYFHYQPIVGASNEKMVSTESLMRWKEGVNPSDLMVQFEEHGLTSNIFTYALDHIAWQIKKSKLAITFSMNLSVHQILLSDILDQVDEVCRKYKIPPERLQFEVTESHALYDRDIIKEVLMKLRKRGHAVGIDDFGNGYFSFKDFIELPIDFVKLDKEIVHKMDEQENRKEMVSYIVDMAKSQNIRVTVEGIETREQFETWKKMNVDDMQGFYFSKAIDFKRLKHWRL